MISGTLALVLAAGEGKRMKSEIAKVIHTVGGKPMIQRVCGSAKAAGVKNTIIVIGHMAEQIRECMGDSAFYAMQEQRKGTGHAVMIGLAAATEMNCSDVKNVIVLCGDVPLITKKIISDTIQYHEEGGFAVTVITANMENPAGYGRIVRDTDGNILKIVEHKDATEDEKKLTEINTGLFCFNKKELEDALKLIKNDNNQQEYYLTDTVGIIRSKGLKTGAVRIDDNTAVMGINDRLQLAEANKIANKRKIIDLQINSGVTINFPDNVYVDDDVCVGEDTILLPGTALRCKTKIGRNCIIGPDTSIKGSDIGDNVEIINSVVLDSTVGSNAHIGPFAYLRPGSEIGKGVKVGDFVEIKNSVIGEGTKVSHLTYIGDSRIGRDVNFGCGVVTVNYDGGSKHLTCVGDEAFIGCNSNLIAPVNIGKNTYIAAGSTITEDVPDDSFAIARQYQTTKEGYAKKRGYYKNKK